MIKSRKGFTLIELMIVVTIIGILAGIAVQMYGDMTRKSTDAFTKGNLGTIRSALSIYYGNNEGIYPSDDLTCLTNNVRFLVVMPPTRIKPYHQDSNQVTAESTPSETGGWSYDNIPSDQTWGTVRVGCLHTDAKSVTWTDF